MKRISELLENKELFDGSKFEFFQAIIELEIENLLTKDEQNEIKEGIKMTPKAMAVVTRAINEVNQKVLAENWEDALAEGESRTAKKIAKNLKGKLDIKELSEATGLTIEEIEKL